MAQFHNLQVFVKVAELSGFASAARALNMSAPAVTRAISALEDRMGVRLFVRTTRNVRLSESGQRFLVDAKRILQDLEDAENAAVGLHVEPRGELRLTAPVLFGRLYVTPVLIDFLHKYPDVSGQTLFVDRLVNLMEEGQDVAIRIGELQDSSLTAIRAGFVRRVLFASPQYLARFGHPKTPDDLQGHQIVQSLAMGNSTDWAFLNKGVEQSVKVHPKLKMNTNDAVIEAVRSGAGISRLLSYQLTAAMAKNEVVIILEDFETPPVPIHVVHHEGRQVSAKVRAFVDFMIDRLRACSDLR